MTIRLTPEKALGWTANGLSKSAFPPFPNNHGIGAGNWETSVVISRGPLWAIVLSTPRTRRQNLNSLSISTAEKDVMMAFWRTGPSKQYQVYLERWEQFCRYKGINQLDANIENVIDFLATLFAFGLGYSAINTARSALSSALFLPDNTTFGSHPLVARSHPYDTVPFGMLV